MNNFIAGSIIFLSLTAFFDGSFVPESVKGLFISFMVLPANHPALHSGFASKEGIINRHQ